LRQVLCQLSNYYSIYNIVRCSSKRFCCKLQSFRGGIVVVYIQGVTGGTDQTSGECSLGHTIPI